jgi:hypothetical protein
MTRIAFAALAALALAGGAAAQEDDDDGGLGQAGLLSAANRGEMPRLTLASGVPVAEGPITLKSGTYYELEIEADGSAELGLAGAGFFRAIWIDEIVINGLEVRPIGLDSVEFDEAGVMEIGFLAIKPGSYELRIPGTTGETQRAEIVIE